MSDAKVPQDHPLSVLELRWTDRPPEDGATPRRFLDYVVDGQPLFQRLGQMGYITPLGWIVPKHYDRIVSRLQLQAEPELEEGRQALYVCPECADIGCNAITVVVSRKGDRIVWSDFAYYNVVMWRKDHPGSLREYDYHENLEDVGPFVFDAAAYSKVLQAGLKTLRKMPPGHKMQAE